MVQLRHSQQNLGEVFFAREAESLTEAWMKQADQILEDGQLLDLVHEQLGRRCPLSRKRGRNATPAEVVLRLMVLKHVRNWGYDVLEREVKANLVYRMFTRIGTETVPDEYGKSFGKPEEWIKPYGAWGRTSLGRRKKPGAAPMHTRARPLIYLAQPWAARQVIFAPKSS
jgi:Transposase domain (DUF772)